MLFLRVRSAGGDKLQLAGLELTSADRHGPETSADRKETLAESPSCALRELATEVIPNDKANS
ncbi:MAG: hypothetical protein ACRD3O_09060, partial [Terriglobia bacterium]